MFLLFLLLISQGLFYGVAKETEHDLFNSICISRPSAFCLAPGPGPGPKFAFTGPGPQLYLLALAPNLYLPALSPNLYLPALAPNVC